MSTKLMINTDIVISFFRFIPINEIVFFKSATKLYPLIGSIPDIQCPIVNIFLGGAEIAGKRRINQYVCMLKTGKNEK